MATNLLTDKKNVVMPAVEYYSAGKKKQTADVTTWMNIKNIVSERSQRQKNDPTYMKCPGKVNSQNQKADQWFFWS